MRLRTLPLVAGLAAPLALTGCVVSGGSRNGSAGSAVIVLVLPFLFFALVALAARRSGRRRTRRRAPEVSPRLLRAELTVLADDVLRLEPQVALKEEARNDYESAAHRYRVAQAALDQTDEPVDLDRVQRVVDEANWSMARARAIVEGNPAPAPPAALRRPGSAGEPAVDLDERDEPTYVGSPASFRSGWFGGTTGLFGGLLLGSMLGGLTGWVVEERSFDDSSGFGDGGDGW